MAKEKDIQAMAEKLGIKKENLELGLKSKDSKKVEEGIKKAYDFVKNKGKKK